MSIGISRYFFDYWGGGMKNIVNTCTAVSLANAWSFDHDPTCRCERPPHSCQDLHVTLPPCTPLFRDTLRQDQPVVPRARGWMTPTWLFREGRREGTHTLFIEHMGQPVESHVTRYRLANLLAFHCYQFSWLLLIKYNGNF